MCEGFFCLFVYMVVSYMLVAKYTYIYVYNFLKSKTKIGAYYKLILTFTGTLLNYFKATQLGAKKNFQLLDAAPTVNSSFLRF